MSLTALIGHVVFSTRSTVTWATIVLFVVVIAAKLLSKVLSYVNVLTRITKKEGYRGLASSSSFDLPAARPLLPTLPESVTRSDTEFIDRADWVLRMTHHVFSERHQGTQNVIIINDKLNYKLYVKGIVERFMVNYHNKNIAGPVPYAVVVFREGKILNLGDGGDLNWDWQGNFIRSGDKLLAFEPCIPGVGYKQDPWVAA